MNFLQLVQFVQAQIGTSQDLPWSGPAAGTLFSGGVLVATGSYAEYVNWVQMAYKDIQNDQEDWKWRTKQGTFPLIANQYVYSLAQIQAQISDYEDIAHLHFIDDQRYTLVYDPVVGVGDQTFCFFFDYQDWRGWKDRNVIPVGKPAYYTRRPDYTLEFNPIPQKIYNVTLDYKSALDVMAASDTSTPLYLPVRYHEAICWKAIMYWATARENANRYTAAKTEYDRIMQKMYNRELPDAEPYQREYWG